jgi:putative membrane protein insertion efficiency factor
VIGRVLYGLYAYVLRPLWPGGAGPGRHCRFEPSCARYALDAVRLRGPIVGPGLAVWRVCRCNPWNDGGYDPVSPAGHRHDRCEEISH